MAQLAPRDRYVELLMKQLDECHYPSLQMMERLEHAISDLDGARDYLDLLLRRLEHDRYPSPMLLDRVSSLIDSLDR